MTPTSVGASPEILKKIFPRGGRKEKQLIFWNRRKSGSVLTASKVSRALRPLSIPLRSFGKTEWLLNNIIGNKTKNYNKWANTNKPRLDALGNDRNRWKGKTLFLTNKFHLPPQCHESFWSYYFWLHVSHSYVRHVAQRPKKSGNIYPTPEFRDSFSSEGRKPMWCKLRKTFSWELTSLKKIIYRSTITAGI